MHRAPSQQNRAAFVFPAHDRVGRDLYDLSLYRPPPKLKRTMPPAKSVSADAFEEPVPKRTMPPESGESTSPSRPWSVAEIGARRHNDNRARRALRDLRRDAAEEGRARPGRADDDHRRLLRRGRSDEPLGWMALVDKPTGAVVHFADGTADRSSLSVMALTVSLDAPLSTTRRNTNPSPSLLLSPRATRAAPFAESESSTPQMIKPATENPPSLDFPRGSRFSIAIAIGAEAHLDVTGTPRTESSCRQHSVFRERGEVGVSAGNKWTPDPIAGTPASRQPEERQRRKARGDEDNRLWGRSLAGGTGGLACRRLGGQ